MRADVTIMRADVTLTSLGRDNIGQNYLDLNLPSESLERDNSFEIHRVNVPRITATT